ncbi:MAG: hypothetical protein GPOALKHO_000313 [Sodalis sp.]|uniref:hypothetical protein n=1 Tax=Sodalis sp. (in: enterobacteria) TaxID=1898979 RepID=UPI003872D067|nr:MAG: hypothetical protein GPOALKHO_000313 [Sodalis sp.]
MRSSRPPWWIVSAASTSSLADVVAMLGVRDLCAIASEPFTQWVIKDHFVPDASSGSERAPKLVNDVAH